MGRVLGAKTLAEGQKGVLFAATMKVVGFTFLCLPGLIGAVMMKNRVEVNGEVFAVEKSDLVYPALVRAVMPKWSLGFFAAVLLGSVLSTFNSALNSASTIFGLEIYKIYVNADASEERVVWVATAFGTSLTIIACVIAPFLANINSIFGFLQQMNTIVSLPIVTIFFIGISTKMPDAFAAKVGFFVGVVACGLGQLVTNTKFGLESAPFHVHFLHIYFAAFIVAALATALVTYIPAVRACLGKPLCAPYQEPAGVALVDMTRWPSLYSMVGLVLALMAILTVALQVGSDFLFYVFWALWLLALVILLSRPTSTSTATDVRPKKEHDVSQQSDAVKNTAIEMP